MATTKDAPNPQTPPLQQAPEDEPDLLEKIEESMFWLRQHAAKILSVILVATIAWIVWLVIQQRNEARLVAANDSYTAALDTYQKAMAAGNWATAERTAKMREAVQQADEVARTWPDTVVARNALLLKGNAYFFAGDALGTATNTNEAIKAFEEYLKVATGDEERAAGYLALGYAYENRVFLTNDPSGIQPAVDAFSEVRKIGSARIGFLYYEATLALARINVFAGREEEAKTLLMEVYNARYTAPPDPTLLEGQNEQILAFVRGQAQAFTVGNNARTQLQKLGVDVDALEAEAAKGS